jgi:hypothetical protein
MDINGRRTIALALLLAFVFGAADQYLGSLQGKSFAAGADLSWATDISLLSAPWLVLAFLAGWTQRTPGSAAALGFACTIAALAGYGLMTLSPFEGAELTRQSVAGFVESQRAVIVGGFVTGPLLGWFGYRWRAHRAWLGALVVASAVCLEPLARVIVGDAIRSRDVWLAEVAAGVAMVVYVATRSLAASSQSRSARPRF